MSRHVWIVAAGDSDVVYGTYGRAVAAILETDIHDPTLFEEGGEDKMRKLTREEIADAYRDKGFALWSLDPAGENFLSITKRRVF